ncbi:MAG TPA: TylF/MycF/NovP-related O-methyltransferase [Gemmatimonadaceae bacterium]|nr:TylF/MycF/NovP-related O-methyltransferase [Gemmatimonadaceae bacterium]
MRSLIWRAIRRGLRFAGVDAFPRRENHHYVSSVFGATARKQVDIRSLPGFGPLAAAAISSGRTLLSYDRLYTIYQALDNLRRSLPDGSPLNCVEIGVFRGGTSEFVLNSAAALGFKSIQLHCFDTFAGHASADIVGDNAHHRSGDFSDTSVAAVKALLAGFDGVHLHPGRVQDTAHDIAGLPIHFAHIDVDLFEPMLFSLQMVARQLVPGGWIVVDDYGHRTCPGVAQAVSEFLARSPHFFQVHLLTGQGLLLPQNSRSVQ